LGLEGNPSLFDSQTWNYPLEKALRESQFVSGFERLGSSAVLFASGPILKSDSADPPAGVLLFTQKLKPESFPLLEPEDTFPLLLIEGKVALAGNRGTPEELKEIEGLDIPLKDNYSFVTLHSGALLASRPIYNPEGKNIGYLAIYDFAGNVSEARRSAVIFSIVVGASFLLLVFLASGFLQRWLLAPLNALNQEVHQLVSGKKEAERKWPQDQIGALAESLVKLYRESQEARQKAEADNVWFRGIIESSQDVLLVFDSKGKLADANKAAEVFFSTSKNQFLGLEPEEVLKRLNIDPKTISSRFWEGLKEAYSSGKETVYEGYFSAMDKQLLVSFLPLFLGKELKGVILALKDITPLRKSELERRTLVEAVAHDLGSPITSFWRPWRRRRNTIHLHRPAISAVWRTICSF